MTSLWQRVGHADHVLWIETDHDVDPARDIAVKLVSARFCAWLCAADLDKRRLHERDDLAIR